MFKFYNCIQKLYPFEEDQETLWVPEFSPSPILQPSQQSWLCSVSTSLRAPEFILWQLKCCWSLNIPKPQEGDLTDCPLNSDTWRHYCPFILFNFSVRIHAWIPPRCSPCTVHNNWSRHLPSFVLQAKERGCQRQSLSELLKFFPFTPITGINGIFWKFHSSPYFWMREQFTLYLRC